jgi:hypothetical protein
MPIDPETMKKIAAGIQNMLSSQQGQQGQQGQSQGSGSINPMISPARVGELLPATNIKFDPSSATGVMAPPVPKPIISGYQPPPGGEQLTSKLTPQGSAMYSGVQGMMQFVDTWSRKREAKQQSEAENIAQNLMGAIQGGDTATAHEILNDPKATKLLNKVYKGWLTKTEESKKSKKPDPELQGFEQGMQKYLQGKTQQQPQMPHQMGGYLLPSAGPEQKLKAAQSSAMMQFYQQHPSYLVSVTPREGAEMELKMSEMKIGADFQKELAKNYIEIYKSAQTNSAAMDRVIASGGISGENAKEVEGMRERARKQLSDSQFEQKKELARILKEGKPGDQYKTQTALLQAQLRQEESNFGTATSLLSTAAKLGNDDILKLAQQQQKAAQDQIDNINRQIDDLKAMSSPDVQKALNFIFSP